MSNVNMESVQTTSPFSTSQPALLRNLDDNKKVQQAKTKERLSLDAMFGECARKASQVADKIPQSLASELNASIRRINDSHFRLQIWGSDMGADAYGQFTFDDILTLKDSVLPELVQRDLESFQRQFATIDTILTQLLSASGKEMQPGAFDDLFKELRAAIDVIYELVLDLVNLSNSLRMELALQKNRGAYNGMRNEIQRIKELSQDGTSPSDAKNKFAHENLAEDNLDPWAKSSILSFDGGGIRTISSLLILKEILRAVQRLELAIDSKATSSYSPLASQDDSRQLAPPELSAYLPCHYFDYIAGTGTGGLVAIMLGRLRMSITECYMELIDLSIKIFGNQQLLTKLVPNTFIPKYDHKVLEKVMKDLSRKHTSPRSRQQIEGEVPYASGPETCKTIVFAFQTEKRAPYIFRSYENHCKDSAPDDTHNRAVRNPGPATNAAVWQAARATSAAPTYFREVDIDQDTFLDGGLVVNNPTMETLGEVWSLSGEPQKAIELVLSIGTGQRNISTYEGIGPIFFRSLLRQSAFTLADPENTDRITEYFSISNFAYKRFNVDEGLGNIKLYDWKTNRKNENLTLNQINAATSAYLKKPSVRAEVEETAKILVKNRRRRSQTSRWKSFCLGEEVKI